MTDPTFTNQYGETVPLLDDGQDRCMSCSGPLGKRPAKRADFVCPRCTKAHPHLAQAVA